MVAIAFREPDSDQLIESIVSARTCGAGTPTIAEIGIVMTARIGSDARGMTSRMIEEFEILEVPFGVHHWREAVSAYARYGRGRHRAGLNFGDCLSYAVARLAGEPLLFVGKDFAATDIETV